MHRKILRTYGRKKILNNGPTPLFLGVSNHAHRIFDSSDSDENSFKTTGSDQNPFESTFDRIAKNIKLPPMPPEPSMDSSIFYVSSSSSANLTNEHWTRNIEVRKKVPPKKSGSRKRRKKTIEKPRIKTAPIVNRKRQSTLHDINKDETATVEISLQKKTKRSMKNQTLDINSTTDKSNLNLDSITRSPSEKELKPCCVELTRIPFEKNHIECERSPNRIKTSPASISKTPNIKDCHIVLPRLDVNSVRPSKKLKLDMKTIVSSTPLVHRIHSSVLKPTFSPISDSHKFINDESNDTQMWEIENNMRTRTRLTNPLDDDYIIEPTIMDNIQMSQTHVSKSPKKNISLGATGKSSPSLFVSDGTIDNNCKITQESHTETTEKLIKTISLVDGEKSQSMFEETKPIVNNGEVHSVFQIESTENISNTDDPSLDESDESNEIRNSSEYSKGKSVELNASLPNGILNNDKVTEYNSVTTNIDESAVTPNKDTSDESYHLVMSSPSSKDNGLEIDENDTIKLENNSENEIKVNNKANIASATEPFIVLTRLNDPVKITQKRDKYVNWDRRLKTIAESFERRASTTIPENELSTNEDYSVVNKTTHIEENKMVYLKPGKSWARSLSILNQFNKNEDIEIMSMGKGRKWRESVKSILEMQSQGVVLSCVKSSQKENDHSIPHDLRTSNITRISSSAVSRAAKSISPNRFIRRISVRVIPDHKCTIIEENEIKDASFLEVYGIPTRRSRKTFGKRSTLIAPRDTLIYNLRCSNVDNSVAVLDPIDAARNVVLQRCNQTNYIPFEECYPETFLEHCHKIGEGVYGEVFLYETKKEKSVIKIIPIEGEKLVNGEPQKKFSEILSEIVIAKELHNLRYHSAYKTNGFVEVKNIRCLIGKYPQKLIELWRAYDEEKTSDNDCPSMFSDDQLYIILELNHGGQDLEAFIFQNANEAYISFLQTALSLAVAEKALDFEHRDLHWGNVLISRTDEDEISYKLGADEIILPCKGLKVAIIDFTLSRMSYQGCSVFNDLALDPALFTAVGEYQFEIYKLMKAKVGNKWQLFEPYTNILWLHYILEKMIMSVRYKKKTTKVHKNAISKLQELKDVLLDYDSTYDFITNCNKLTNLQCKKSFF